jgi:LytS/YehU family sensor histidine kinase
MTLRDWFDGCAGIARRVLGTVLLCLAISALTVLVFGDAPLRSLTYSLCIGLSCHLFIESGITLVARWQQRSIPPAQRAGWPSHWAVALCVVLGATAGMQLGVTLADAITGLDTAGLFSANRRGVQVTLVLALAASAIGTRTLYVRKALAEAAARAEAAQRAATEAQLRLLQSQLEPHMLFNTLANLRALIGIDPLRAQAMLDRLIAFLRATLGASRVASHPLQAEFARIGDYLELMGVRMGARLASTLELPPELAEQQVPPLLLQPLVENAIQHGLEPKLQGGRVAVQAHVEGSSLVLSVRDTGLGAEAPPSSGSGFGTQQVRERLATLYGSAASLTLQTCTDTEGGMLARIVLPLTRETA